MVAPAGSACHPAAKEVTLNSRLKDLLGPATRVKKKKKKKEVRKGTRAKP